MISSAQAAEMYSSRLFILILGACLCFSEARNAGDQSSININFGGGAFGNRFVPESTSDVSGDTWTYENSHATILGAEDKNRQALKSHRYGTNKGSYWSYSVYGMRPGIWDCTLHWAETSKFHFGAGLRVFEVIFDGDDEPESRFVDVHAKVGAFTSYTETFTNIAYWGWRYEFGIPFTVTLAGTDKGDPFLSAMTCAVTSCTDNWGATQPCPNENKNLKRNVALNFGGPAVSMLEKVSSKDVWGLPMDSSSTGFIAGGEVQYQPALGSHSYGKHWGFAITGLDKGTYECKAMFAETYAGNFEAGKRVFNFKIGNPPDLSYVRKGIDAFASVGAYAIYAETFSNILVTAELGSQIKVTLYGVVGDAFLSAIHCVRTGCVRDTTNLFIMNKPCMWEPVTLPIPRPWVRDYAYINFAGGGYAGIVERYDTGSFSVGVLEGSSGTEVNGFIGADSWMDQMLSTHIYSPTSFNYELRNMRVGTYTCTALFAETHTTNFSPGKRVFDVDLNSQIVHGVDVYARVGGNTADSVVFTNVGVYPAMGSLIRLTLTGQPGKGDPFISGLTCKRVRCINLGNDGQPTGKFCSADVQESPFH